MTDSNAAFVGSIPENYDKYLGPVLFEPYARDMARRLEVKEGGSVLEVACGTGIVTRRLRERLPKSVRLVATDLNQPMIDYARGKPGMPVGIEWRQADACALPFEDGFFDAVVCQYGLMFVPDKDLALREARRVLASGGTCHLSVWDSLERNRFVLLANETILKFFTNDPPTFYEIPFCLHRQDELKRMLAGAGFSDVKSEAVSFQSESPSARDLARGLIEGNPVGGAIRERGKAGAEEVIEAVAKVLARELGDRPARVPLHAFVLTARAGV
jgi:ubiquinone/menaquinone biosynthesis C-methylase UbiE